MEIQIQIRIELRYYYRLLSREHQPFLVPFSKRKSYNWLLHIFIPNIQLVDLNLESFSINENQNWNTNIKNKETQKLLLLLSNQTVLYAVHSNNCTFRSWKFVVRISTVQCRIKLKTYTETVWNASAIPHLCIYLLVNVRMKQIGKSINMGMHHFEQ